MSNLPDALTHLSPPSEAWGAQLSLSCNMGTLSPGAQGGPEGMEVLEVTLFVFSGFRTLTPILED